MEARDEYKRNVGAVERSNEFKTNILTKLNNAVADYADVQQQPQQIILSPSVERACDLAASPPTNSYNGKKLTFDEQPLDDLSLVEDTVLYGASSLNDTLEKSGLSDMLETKSNKSGISDMLETKSNKSDISDMQETKLNISCLSDILDAKPTLVDTPVTPRKQDTPDRWR